MMTLDVQNGAFADLNQKRDKGLILEAQAARNMRAQTW